MTSEVCDTRVDAICFLEEAVDLAEVVLAFQYRLGVVLFETDVEVGSDIGHCKPSAKLVNGYLCEDVKR